MIKQKEEKAELIYRLIFILNDYYRLMINYLIEQITIQYKTMTKFWIKEEKLKTLFYGFCSFLLLYYVIWSIFIIWFILHLNQHTSFFCLSSINFVIEFCLLLFCVYGKL